VDGRSGGEGAGVGGGSLAGRAGGIVFSGGVVSGSGDGEVGARSGRSSSGRGLGVEPRVGLSTSVVAAGAARGDSEGDAAGAGGSLSTNGVHTRFPVSVP
jgi:hypothetical protein